MKINECNRKFTFKSHEMEYDILWNYIKYMIKY